MEKDIALKGSVIFLIVVSPAGVDPTSSNKYEIESSFETLSRAGFKMHIGKDAIKPETVKTLKRARQSLLSFPPVTALLESHSMEHECVVWLELGIEASVGEYLCSREEL